MEFSWFLGNFGFPRMVLNIFNNTKKLNFVKPFGSLNNVRHILISNISWFYLHLHHGHAMVCACFISLIKKDHCIPNYFCFEISILYVLRLVSRQRGYFSVECKGKYSNLKVAYKVLGKNQKFGTDNMFSYYIHIL